MSKAFRILSGFSLFSFLDNWGKKRREIGNIDMPKVSLFSISSFCCDSVKSNRTDLKNFPGILTLGLTGHEKISITQRPFFFFFVSNGLQAFKVVFFFQISRTKLFWPYSGNARVFELDDETEKSQSYYNNYICQASSVHFDENLKNVLTSLRIVFRLQWLIVVYGYKPNFTEHFPVCHGVVFSVFFLIVHTTLCSNQSGLPIILVLHNNYIFIERNAT